MRLVVAICLTISAFTLPVGYCSDASEKAAILQLITDKDVAMMRAWQQAKDQAASSRPPAPPKTEVPEDKRAPTIIVESQPRQITDSFVLKVRFASPIGRPIEARSTRVKYRNIDITDRLRDHITGEGIHVPNASVPPGYHEFTVLVKDDEGRAGERSFYLVNERHQK